ncbi:MAG TPA: T9SS type A sorting domain-containing protein, partial [Saprospiraceae bacterium]|nr:T9SS type A sorting domain-containing protein [Saprospiraceae bacterium]
FPDPNLAPGTYTITLLPEGSPECLSAVREVAAPDIQIDCAQTAEGVEFRVVSDLHFSSKLFLCDVNGKQVALKTTEIKPGSNHIQVDNNNLTPGIYFYQFTGKYGQKSGKLIIN